MSFAFVSGRISLDFVGTLKWRNREQSEEQLTEPDRLADWARAGQLIDEPLLVTPAKLARAVAVREALYRAVVQAIEGGEPDPAAVKMLNEAARRRPLTLRLVEGRLRRSGSVEQLLSSVIRDGLELLGGEQLQQVRQCTGQDCTRLFLDTSRAGKRRWCGMAECGNRAKVAAFRRRQHT
ncbi:MAG TPA: ABATE domain-containing protein [Jatrophihabitans sp.]|jgi:predicted RNA-binding Zn ribbon-like protein|nr:ABATE domain-containing protein [Jatrophihabitans sp.]